MEFPDDLILLEKLGLEKIDVDPDLSYVQYRKSDSTLDTVIDVSFCEVEKSFQIVMQLAGKELLVISSERVRDIWVEEGREAARLRVRFEIEGVISEAVVTTEPSIHCNWWTISSS